MVLEDIVNPEFVGSLATMFLAILAIIKTRVDMRGNKVTHERQLQELKAETTAKRDAWELEKERNVQDQITKLQDEMRNQLTQADNDLRESQKKYQIRLDQMTSDLNSHMEKRAEAEGQMSQLQVTIQELKNQHEEAMSAAIEVAVREAKAAVEERHLKEKIETENSELRLKIAHMEKEIADLNAKVDRQTQEIEQLRLRADKDVVNE